MINFFLRFPFFALVPLFVHAHEAKSELERWIHVTGVGEAKASPDLAILRMGVMSTAKTAQLATEQNNASIREIFLVLESMGLKKSDFETERFQLVPQSQYRKGLPPLITGYRVSNSLILRIRDLGRVGEIMQASIEAGGNNFESLTYAVDDFSQYLEEARVLAVQDARKKAVELTRSLGVEVGKPLTIQEASGHQRPPMHERRMMQADMMAESVPVQGPSELKTEVRVQVKFELK